MMENVLESARRLHLMGIGGTGLAPLALVLQGRGFQVSGCDREASPPLDQLARQGIATHIGHAPAHLTDADCLIVSSAIPADHPEVAAARASGRPVQVLAKDTVDVRQPVNAVYYRNTQLSARITSFLDFLAERLAD